MEINKGFFNFVSYITTEYKSLYPRTLNLMDQILFVIGNGYEFDDNKGIPVEDNGQCIDSFPTLTQLQIETFVAKCKVNEEQLIRRYSIGRTEEEILERIKAECNNISYCTFSEQDFTEESFYSDMITQKQAYESGKRWRKEYVRPYPFCEDFSLIYRLNKNTPKWFLEISRNFCNAWAQFLSEELDSGNVSESPDWSDAKNTTLHRDAIKECVTQLNKLIEGK